MENVKVENEPENEAETEESDKALSRFTIRSALTDFVLDVEGTKLFVARGILSLASPVFKRMFASDFRESSENEMKLYGKKMEDVEEFLNIIYPDTLSEITYDNVFRILPFVEEYQVFHLKPKCEKIILQRFHQYSKTNELFRVLNEACRYDLKDVREECVSKLSERNKRDLFEAKKNSQIPDGAWIDILERKIDKREGRSWFNFDEPDEEEVNSRTKENYMKMEIKTLREYMRKCIQRSVCLDLEEDTKWETKEVCLKVAVEEKLICYHVLMFDCKTSRLDRKVIIGNSRFVVASKYISDTKYNFKRLIIKTQHEGKDQIFSEVRLQSTVLNKEPSKDNITVCTKGKFDFKQSIDHEIKIFSDLADERNGFSTDGYVWILVQIFISQDK